jgi:hypothetical protein
VSQRKSREAALAEAYDEITHSLQRFGGSPSAVYLNEPQYRLVVGHFKELLKAGNKPIRDLVLQTKWGSVEVRRAPRVRVV